MEQLTIHEAITALEEQLLAAFRTSNVNQLDELIHDHALFTLPTGQVVTKAKVLDNYRAGTMAMHSITASEQLIHLIDDTAVVSMQLELNGVYQEETFNTRFRYLRVWKSTGADWKVIATSGVQFS